MKLLVIGLVVAIALLATWRIIAGRVDRTNPDQVAAAFIGAIKGEDLKKASGFWVPDAAETWQANAEKSLRQMQSGTSTRFFEGLPSKPTFTKVHNPKSPANEQTLNCDATSVDVRQLDGKWWVCKGPL